MDSSTSGSVVPRTLDQLGRSPLYLEVGTSPGDDDVVSSPVQQVGTNQTTVAFQPGGLPTSGELLYARLWTQVLPGLWLPDDIVRFNHADRPVDCAGEMPDVAPVGYREASCSVNGNPICEESGGVLICDLENSVYGDPYSSPSLVVVTRFDPIADGEPPSHPYHFTAYGTAWNGDDFCCLYYDDADVVDAVEAYGTPNADQLSFYALYGEGASLEPHAGRPLSGLIKARGGADIVVGSNSDDTDYDEELWGQRGADLLYGLAGDDLLLTGQEDDGAWGGAGRDVLVAGGDYDELYGGLQGDILCTNNPNDLLIGDDAGFSAVLGDKLYISSGGGTPNSSSDGVGTNDLCGHTSYGTSWGGAGCTHSLTSAPTECAGHL